MKGDIDTVLVLDEAGRQVPMKLITPLFSITAYRTLTEKLAAADQRVKEAQEELRLCQQDAISLQAKCAELEKREQDLYGEMMEYQQQLGVRIEQVEELERERDAAVAWNEQLQIDQNELAALKAQAGVPVKCGTGTIHPTTEAQAVEPVAWDIRWKDDDSRYAIKDVPQHAEGQYASPLFSTPPNHREAMEKALEALEAAIPTRASAMQSMEAMVALKEALK